MAMSARRKDLSAINARAISKAQFGFKRASKFYFLHEQKLYDTKPLVSASYYYATGKRLSFDGFSGGPQTINAINNAIRSSSNFRGSRAFEDILGELRNVAADFDRLAKFTWKIRDFGFSRWVPLHNYKDLQTGGLPGVYVILDSATTPPFHVSISDKRVIYIGETVNQTLSKRLHQFNRSLHGKEAHSGGSTLHSDYHRRRLWLAIRSFPLRPDVSDHNALAFRSSQIQLLEKLLLFQFVHSKGRYPRGNTARTGIRPN
jgi:hypothetical protein